jgi:hypothetical protein
MNPLRDVLGFSDLGIGESKDPCEHGAMEHRRNVDVGYHHVPKRIRTYDCSVQAVKNRKYLNRPTFVPTNFATYKLRTKNFLVRNKYKQPVATNFKVTTD